MSDHEASRTAKRLVRCPAELCIGGRGTQCTGMSLSALHPSTAISGELGLKSGTQLQFGWDAEQNTLRNPTLASEANLDSATRHGVAEKCFISLSHPTSEVAIVTSGE
jgi:hypothetical protein